MLPITSKEKRGLRNANPMTVDTAATDRMNFYRVKRLPDPWLRFGIYPLAFPATPSFVIVSPAYQMGNRLPKWVLKAKNIVDESADVLICSANVSLNLSGGVGADLLERYGLKMQRELHKRISSRSPRAAKQGEIFVYQDETIPFKAVLHCVAVNGWYESSTLIVESIVRDAFHICQDLEARKVALTALATGFGNLDFEGFAAAIKPLTPEEFPPVSEVCICINETSQLNKLAAAFANAGIEAALDQ
jgi:O-acetyl-ADP-ribose deacetylase (regulator of RNase III)